jgi:hypothetical protein
MALCSAIEHEASSLRKPFDAQPAILIVAIWEESSLSRGA